MRYLVLVLSIAASFGFLQGHPIPDIPVLGSFDSNGSMTISVEIDPRGFSEDPEKEPFLQREAFDKLDANERKVLVGNAQNLMSSALRVRFDEGVWFLPEFRFEFVGKSHEKFELEGEVFFLRGSYNHSPDATVNSYQIKAQETAGYDLVFMNILNGKAQKRVNVLWPGEESFTLDLTSFFSDSSTSQIATEANSTALSSTDFALPAGKSSSRDDTISTFLSFLRQGFVHVVPLGVDHILFVLGLFLLSRQWKPLFLQVTMFTVAHTITLGLATLGFVTLESSVVEPLIAASIAVVALENIFFPGYKPRRLVIVFAFGLIHGLGFAGAFSELELHPTSLFAGLFGFNLGVEAGQLAVLSIAYALTVFIQKQEDFRTYIVIPGSTVIACMGVYWTLTRIFSS
ncbi:MAG: hypothetical protein CMI26_12020 [Opitutae bacterium]|nr:hypothetical protein [Opitutae bacterium]|tara:strand:+ start:11571 stop:12773 length:1203 start_codon:yes stop_codon:yes gene_type:complete